MHVVFYKDKLLKDFSTEKKYNFTSSAYETYGINAFIFSICIQQNVKVGYGLVMVKKARGFTSHILSHFKNFLLTNITKDV